MRLVLVPATLLWGAVLLFHAAAAAPATPSPSGGAQNLGDWSVHCVAGSLPPCEMFQRVQDNAGKRLLNIAIAYEPRQDRYVIQLITPLGVSFARGVRITSSALSVQTLPYQRCDGAGCYVTGAIERGALDSLGRSDPKAKVTIAPLDGRDTDLPLSLRGFSDARTAMENLARKNVAAAASAKPPAPAPGRQMPAATH